MHYIPAKVVFNDTERQYLKDYIAEWDANGEKQKAIDTATEFDICTVREGEQDVRGFRIDYEEQGEPVENGNGEATLSSEVSYVSFQGLQAFMARHGYRNGKQYHIT